MENFYNYEQVLNALKAEYVNARNLKKVANSAKRATKNAASFSNRKVNEKTTLENRVDSIESVMDSTLSNAIYEADQKKWTDLKSKLSELKGKLKNIENGEYLLVQSPLINPLDLTNKHEEVSPMDSSSFNMLKNLLTTAINDAETAINAAYSTDYNTLSQATKIIYGESEISNENIMAKYFEKKSTLESLFQKAESAIDEYVNDIFSEIDGLKGLEYACLDLSKQLSYKKDELATLLVNEGPQSVIDNKESEIESVKQAMINNANELKLAKIKLEQKAEDRFKIVAEYIDDASVYAGNDFYQFIDVNRDFLKDTVEPNRTELTDYRASKLYSSLFDKFAQSNSINGAEYTQFKNEVDNVRTNLMGLNNIIQRNSDRAESLSYPQVVMNMAQDSNGKFEFKSYVPTNDIMFYKDYNRALHNATSEYIIRKADRDSRRIELRDMVFTEAGSVINKIQQNYSDIRDAKFFLRRAHKFHKWNTELYTGTQEQQSAYNDFIAEHNPAFQLFNQTEQTYQFNQAPYNFNLAIFENEFNLLNTLTATKTSTEDYLSTLGSQAGSIDPSFAYGSGFNGAVFSTAIQSDGKIVVGGYFNGYNETTANQIIRLNIDGSRDTSFAYGNGFNNDVLSIVIQSDGKIVVGGRFTGYNETSANQIIRLNIDGSIDTSFVYGTGFYNTVRYIAIQSDDKILVGGDFTYYNGTGANRIIRLNSDGSVDTSFVNGAGFNNPVFSIAIQSNGKIVVSGQFSDYDGTGANHIIRLNSDGSIDTSFVYGTGFSGGLAYSIAIQSDDKILLGGYFSEYNGIPASAIIRLNTDGSIDTSFVYGTFTNEVDSIVIQSDGKILLGGSFTTYNGTSANRIVSLNSITVFESDEAEANFPAALISRNAAVEEYNLFLDTKFGEEWFGLGLNQFTKGQWLLDMKNARDTSYAYYTAAEAAWNTELAEFEVLKSQMTLEEVDDYYKKEGITSAHYISNAEDRLANLLNRDSGLMENLHQIKNPAITMIGSFREVSDAQFEESQLASLLGNVKYFLDSENNLLAGNKKEFHSKESLKRKLEREMAGMQMGRPMNPSLPESVFNTDLLNVIGSDPYQYKNELMSGINNIIIRFNPNSFADAIIAEATNGTRWW